MVIRFFRQSVGNRPVFESAPARGSLANVNGYVVTSQDYKKVEHDVMT